MNKNVLNTVQPGTLEAESRKYNSPLCPATFEQRGEQRANSAF